MNYASTYGCCAHCVGQTGHFQGFPNFQTSHCPPFGETLKSIERYLNEIQIYSLQALLNYFMSLSNNSAVNISNPEHSSPSINFLTSLNTYNEL